MTHNIRMSRPLKRSAHAPGGGSAYRYGAISMKLISLICASMLAVTGLDSIAVGCACPAYTLSGHARKAKIVFLAEAVGKYALPGAAVDNPARRVVLKVGERFKGKVPDSVWINETGDPGCAASFPLHTKVVLFLNVLSTGTVSDCDVEFLQGEITSNQREELLHSSTPKERVSVPHEAEKRSGPKKTVIKMKKITKAKDASSP